jgi:hypothetical protein
MVLEGKDLLLTAGDAVPPKGSSGSFFFREPACNYKSIAYDSPKSWGVQKLVDVLFVREEV